MNSIKTAFAKAIAEHLGQDALAVEGAIARPPDVALGMYAYPCFALAKSLRKAPPAIAADMAAAVAAPEGTELVAAGPYLNLKLKPGVLAREAVTEALAREPGKSVTVSGTGRTVLVDYSSPNAGKELVYHHIRSTVIGAALCKIYAAAGWNVVAVNHLGDWGTQFGKLILMWLREHGMDQEKALADLDKVTLSDLNRMYVGFKPAAQQDPSMEEEARLWFARLEAKEPFARRCWECFIEVSKKELNKVYVRFGAKFDHFLGESFYEDKLDGTIARIEKAGILEESEGAQVVHVGEDIPPCLIRKRDGATLYATRDLAAAIWRQQEFKTDRALYVVDSGQSLHFKQVFAVLERMGEVCAKGCVHVPFGLVLGKGEDGQWSKVSTRSGTGSPLPEVMDRAAARIRETMESLAKKRAEQDGREKEAFDPAALDRLAEAVGVGALVFNELKNRRMVDTKFDLDSILSFEGDTGPYIMYAHVRLAGILRKVSVLPDPAKARWELLCEPQTEDVLSLLTQFGERVDAAVEGNEPSVVAQYALELAEKVHAFTHHHRVLDVDATPERLLLVQAAKKTLAAALALLGLEPVERM
ncbi:MAG TPA: arginine--tRNA ligase [Fibrobacteria bacterium]|nr:arginine--tRNA ligase [Fibrobacteria bacterium]